MDMDHFFVSTSNLDLCLNNNGDVPKWRAYDETRKPAVLPLRFSCALGTSSTRIKGDDANYRCNQV